MWHDDCINVYCGMKGGTYMDQVGFVINTNDGYADVEIRRVSACGDKCGSCGGNCDAPKTRVKIKNSIKAHSGDFVEIDMETSQVMKSTFVACRDFPMGKR